uniref:Uncharacterized protein n=1 Tax=Plectus sambesii TaxID=2011161 RepID=A0A914WM68_9BILA
MVDEWTVATSDRGGSGRPCMKHIACIPRAPSVFSSRSLSGVLSCHLLSSSDSALVDGWWWSSADRVVFTVALILVFAPAAVAAAAVVQWPEYSQPAAVVQLCSHVSFRRAIGGRHVAFPNRVMREFSGGGGGATGPAHPPTYAIYIDLPNYRRGLLIANN